jgi:hypothetical protein
MEKEEEKEFIPRVEEYTLKSLGYKGPYLRFYGQSILYQQAFRWFREEHNMHLLPVEMYPYIWSIDGYSETYSSFEEAELECLRRLIEIVSKKLAQVK